MQITLKTETLQSLVNKAVKGMSNNKMLPITEMIGINLSATTLSLVTTDGRNKVEVMDKVENPDNTTFSISVNGNNFSKLIQKMTSQNTTLIIEDNKLEVKGNGSYTFSLPVDEDGNVVVLSSIVPEGVDVQEVNVADLKASYALNKESVATTMETPAYTGFYYDQNGSITTNSLKISSVKTKLLNNPVLLYANFVELFTLLEDEKAQVIQNNSDIYVKTNSIILKGSKMSDLSEFPVDSIRPFLETDMEHKVRVNKQALLDLLERISIFVTPYDKNGIRIDFTKNGMVIWTIKGDSSELLPYSDSENVVDHTIKLDITNFKALVSSNPEEEVTIHYGSDVAIKMTFGNTIQVVSLQDGN